MEIAKGLLGTAIPTGTAIATLFKISRDRGSYDVLKTKHEGLFREEPRSRLVLIAVPVNIVLRVSQDNILRSLGDIVSFFSGQIFDHLGVSFLDGILS